MKKKYRQVNNKSLNKKLIIAAIAVIFCISIGYAAVQSTINIIGSTSADRYGSIFVEDFSITDYNGVTETLLPVYDAPTIETALTFGNSDLAYITYSITVANGTNSVQRYTGETFNVSSAISDIISYEISGGIDINDYLLPGESTTFTLNYHYASTATAGDYDLIMIFNFANSGSFYAASATTTASITSSSPTSPIAVDVVNLNNSSIYYTISLSNDKFELVDGNGNSLSTMTITASDTDLITVYIKKKDSGVIYYKNSYTTDVILSTGGTNYTLTNLAIATEATPGYEDYTPPQIGAVSLNIVNTVGTFTANWSRTDSGGAPVSQYIITLYDSDNNVITTQNVDGNTTSYSFTNQSEAAYHATVYGIDEADNSGDSSCPSATTSTTNCRLSNSTAMKWTFSVTYNITNGSASGVSTITRGNALSFTISASSGYSLPYSITVTKDGNSISNYTYSSSSGAGTVPSVDGDIVITGKGTINICLVEGTKIALADGTYKNIEDISYTDLLKVWSYDEGRVVYEYPIWLENKGTASDHQLITFDDGTTLKTVLNHGLFNKDLNMFVTVLDKDNFKVGTNVVIMKNNKLETVKVTSIKTIYEEVNYYHVVSTRYYNVFANNILTTDGTVMLSNLYGFTDNITWPESRDEYMSSGDLYSYGQLSSALPHYMYVGLRAGEAKYLVNNGYLSLDLLLYYFKTNQTNPSMLKLPISNNLGNLWMVTTSDDVVTNFNRSNYLMLEGSVYTLRNPKSVNNKTFVGWYNTGDNKYYLPGDEVKVNHGMYFEAIWN